MKLLVFKRFVKMPFFTIGAVVRMFDFQSFSCAIGIPLDLVRFTQPGLYHKPAFTFGVWLKGIYTNPYLINAFIIIHILDGVVTCKIKCYIVVF